MITDPNYQNLPYEQKVAYLQNLLRQEIFDFEEDQAMPDEDVLSSLDDEIQEDLIENITDYASDISYKYSELIIKYIELMLEAKLGQN